jgi:ferredoxin
MHGVAMPGMRKWREQTTVSAPDLERGDFSMFLKWIPVVDPDLCNGCGACVEACGPGCLVIRKLVSHLISPETCGSEGHCIPACDYGAIKMKWVAMDGAHDTGKWVERSQLLNQELNS